MLRRVWFVFLLVLIAGQANWSEEPRKHRTGSFQVMFNEHHPLSPLREVIKRCRVSPTQSIDWEHAYTLNEEPFFVHVPSDYSPSTAYGLLVWVTPGKQAKIPQAWLDCLQKYKLIFVGANNVGNQHNVYTKRIPLTLDAVHNMPRYYNVDPKRIYITGLSGGGRVSSIMAMHYSDIFSGGLFIIGCNYWKTVRVPGTSRSIWKQNMSRPIQKYLSRAMHHGRYVLLTGDTDGNRPQMQAYYADGYGRYFDHATYLQVKGMGHEPPPVKWFDLSIAYMVGAIDSIKEAAQDYKDSSEKQD
jgi:enterochelin esterase-like enzyme